VRQPNRPGLNCKLSRCIEERHGKENETHAGRGVGTIEVAEIKAAQQSCGKGIAASQPACAGFSDPVRQLLENL